MTFAKRAIDLTVQLGQGDFGQGGFDTVKMSGLRISAVIEMRGLPSLNQAQIRVYGLPLSMMNQLAQVGLIQNAIRANYVTLYAGDTTAGMPIAFGGGIRYAWPDLQSAPEASFNITAFTGMLGKMKPIPPSSYSGGTDVVVVMQSLAAQLGLTLENNAVTARLASPYLPGTAIDQVQAAARAANIIAWVDRDQGKLVILPKGGVRGGSVPLISAATGLVGYPSYIGPGWISLRTLYNPSIQFMGQIDVQSVIKPASGLWRVRKITHDLESQVPGGSWFSEIQASLFDRTNA